MEKFNIILTVIFALMVVTNVITEVIKKITWDKIPTNLVVVIIAEILTIASGATYASINNIAIQWYHIFGAVVTGIFVSYAAMFGFDKLRQTIGQINDKAE